MSTEQKASPFRFPSDIQLESSPLAEAWLEIRWGLESIEPGGLADDQGFTFALGRFYDAVKDDFGFHEKLEASRAPQELTPHVPRHRFRSAKDGWPLLQFGPGIATVNFTQPYSWDDFKEKALYLRIRLLEAYGDERLETERAVLRYRNVTPFDYHAHDLFGFLQDSLNVSVSLPGEIPGSVGTVDWPSRANVVLSFDLVEPPSRGTVRIGTGKGRPDDGEQEQKLVLWQLELGSYGANAPHLEDQAGYEDWLELAHRVIHEWFFSMVEGPLLQEYLARSED